MKDPAKGTRVAHRELDDPDGGARQGIVEDVVGEEPALVVMRTGRSREAYDSRELVQLSGFPGAVVLHPRHALLLLRTSWARLAFVLDLALMALFVVAAFSWKWPLASLLLLGVVVVLVAWIALLILERDAIRHERSNPL